MTQIITDTEWNSVYAMLENLDSSLSPEAITAFLLGPVTEYLSRRAQDRFTHEGDDAVGRWAPLSEATVAIREEMGYGGSHPINHRTGQLEDFIVNSSGSVNVFADGAELEWPGYPPYGYLENKMDTAQRGKQASPVTPPRPVLGMSEADDSAILTLLRQEFYINEISGKFAKRGPGGRFTKT